MGTTVAVTGASGFIGRAVMAALRSRGYRCIAVARAQLDDPNAFAGADAVIHLAGEPIAGRWTPEKRAAIANSRIEGTRAVVCSIAACTPRPRVLLAASAVGYYGSRGATPLVESSAPGTTFLAGVCVEWEREANAAAALGVRVANMRIGIVLGAGGALAAMRGPFVWGAGGPFGSGSQYVPWIHIDDLARLFVYALEREQMRGPVNAVTPDYATSARFAHALGAALHRPAIAPAPAFALRAILGEFANTLLASQLVIPAVAEDAAFAWRFPSLEEAMIAVVAANPRHDPAVHRFRCEQTLPIPLERAFAFFSDPGNLEAITPPSLRFAIVAMPDRVERGARISYDLRLHGVPLHWTTMIARWVPPHEFVDVQLRGPYMLWRHRHTFRATDAGIVIRDEVDYLLPLEPLGDVALPLVRADLDAIFAYRRAAINRLAT